MYGKSADYMHWTTATKLFAHIADLWWEQMIAFIPKRFFYVFFTNYIKPFKNKIYTFSTVNMVST